MKKVVVTVRWECDIEAYADIAVDVPDDLYKKEEILDYLEFHNYDNKSQNYLDQVMVKCYGKSYQLNKDFTYSTRQGYPWIDEDDPVTVIDDKCKKDID